MRSPVRRIVASWAVWIPAASIVMLVATWGRELGGIVVVIVAVLLAGTVLAAVQHAEVVAHRVGSLMGSLVLAVAVTVIEVALIVSLMVSGGPEKASLARDTVFAALMITCNGIVGLSLLVAAIRRRVVVFNAEGSGAALATIAALATLSLVLPTFTTSTPGPTFSGAQLAFAAIASLGLYALFVFVQTVRHREDFLPAVDAAPSTRPDHGDDRPSSRAARLSMGMLGVALIGVVGLSKAVSPALESAVREAGLPLTFVGVVIALLVLLPESIAAVRSAVRDQIQTSFNLAYGSAMASIGLTIPVIAAASIWLAFPLELGLNSVELVLLTLTVIVGVLTVTPGRATLLQGGVHLAVFTGFIVLAVSP
ncbi:MAG: ionic transporter y4hA [bacterium]|nr:ionic transporter y4hA [bacterium]